MFLPLHDKNPVKHIKFAYVNYSLIAVTCLIYLIQYSLPDRTNDDLTIYFGMIPLVVRDIIPQPLTWVPDQLPLLTYAFLHGDWMHLLSNMLFLFIFGDNIEDAMGHWRYFLFYLACAALAAGAHLLFNVDSNGPLIGASGAVAGVLGAYALLYPHARVFVLAKIFVPIPLPIPAFWFLGFWFASQIFYAMIANEGVVAWWAHIGGMLAGAMLVLVFKRRHIPLFGGR